MIGDRLDNDIFPAKKLGMKTIRILKGFGAYQQPIKGDIFIILKVNPIYSFIRITGEYSSKELK